MNKEQYSKTPNHIMDEHLKEHEEHHCSILCHNENYYNVCPFQEHLSSEVPTDTCYNSFLFSEHAEKKLLEMTDDVSWCIVAIDIENFKLYNTRYGRLAGNELLLHISNFINSHKKEWNALVGYLGNDDFAIMMPYDLKKIDSIYRELSMLLQAYNNKLNVLLVFGVYEILDKTEPVFSMYDRAQLACTSIKGNYAVRIKKFDSSMLEQLESEYVLFTDIQKAFQNHEFTFYLQPKCNMETGKVVSAEALARWESPEKGLISPGVFIPFLEKSGFISELDTFVWEEVCKWLRSMLDRGRQVFPISVNVSIMDIYTLDIAKYLCNLIDKYKLSPHLIELELTESTFATGNQLVFQAMSALRKAGFHILMDDFGKAYSSLNMLSDIDVDVLKLDMRFLISEDKNFQKAVSILKSVHSLADTIGLGMVAEGVETEAQKNFLLEMGCLYGQGFYFYRPISVSEFEKLTENSSNADDSNLYKKRYKELSLKGLMVGDLISESMLSNILGPIVFCDVYEQKITEIRYNEQYASLLGTKSFSRETELHFGEQIFEEEREKIFRMFHAARYNKNKAAVCNVHRRMANNQDIWLQFKTFFLHEQDGHAFYYSAVSDISEVHQSHEILQFLNCDMPGGYYRYKKNENWDFTYISQRFLDIVGFTREDIEKRFDNKFLNMIHPDDRDLARQSAAVAEKTGGNYSLPCRISSRNGYVLVTNQSHLITYEDTEIFQGLILCDLDYYKWLSDDFSNEENTSSTKLIPFGVFLSEADGDHTFSYVSDSMLSMLGYSKEAFAKKFNNSTENMIHSADRERIDEEVRLQLSQSPFVAIEYRIETADGHLKWFFSRGRLMTDFTGKRWFYTCITDYNYLLDRFHHLQWQKEHVSDPIQETVNRKLPFEKDEDFEAYGLPYMSLSDKNDRVYSFVRPREN